MKVRYLYLWVGISILLMFVQCKDSITQSESPNKKTELEKPTLITPGIDSERPSSVTFRWEEIDEAESFHFQLSGEENFSTTIIDNVTDSTTFKAQALPNDTTLYWKVKPVINGVETSWSDIWHFHVVSKSADKTITTTSLISPENGSADQSTSLELKWQEVENADEYKIQLTNSKQFVTHIVDTTIEKIFYQVADLEFEETYYWRVKPLVAETETSWSEAYEFETRQVSKKSKSAPALESPFQGAGDVERKPEFKWKAVDGADSYLLQVSRDDQTIIEREVNKTSFIPSDSLAYNTTYHWRVRAQSENNEGSWSVDWSFKTVEKKEDESEPLSPPALVSPENEASGVERKPRFKWEAVEGAEEYLLHVDDGDGLVVDRQVKGTSFIPPEKFAAEATYRWQVRTVRNGIEGKWSETRSFETAAEKTKDGTEPLSAPALESPFHGTSGVERQPEFKWKTVDGADSYLLQVSQGDQTIIEREVNKTSFISPDKLAYNTSYDWRVRAKNDSIGGSWSTDWSFKTVEKKEDDSEPLSPPALVSPDDGATGVERQPEFKWKAVDGADSYLLQVSQGDQTIIEREVNKTSFIPPDKLAYNTSYDWRVQAEGDGDTQNWSAARSFTTEDQPTDDSDDLTDRAALMDLYNATNGDNWKNNSGWDSDAELNEWYGIETDASGRVTKVDLFENNLTGHLPNSIGDLDKLTYLNVKGNHLTGQIPATIGNMVSLEQLILSGRLDEIGSSRKQPPADLNSPYPPGKDYSGTNNFSGTIPSAIGNLSDLRILEIAHQPKIVGPIPSEIGNLSNLEGLYLSFNDFSDTSIPPSIGNLTSLKHLYLGSTQLEGEIPSSLESLTTLTVLSLNQMSNNAPSMHLTGSIPDFSKLKNLRSINLSNNKLTGEYPHYWNNGNFTHLSRLRFDYNNLTGTLHGFKNLPFIKGFGVSGNNMTGSIDPLTTVPDDIIVISAGWNNFSGDFPDSGWPDFTQLRAIQLNDNDLSGSIPCSFWSKIDNSNLKVAWTGSNNFDDNCSSGMNGLEGNGDVDAN